MGLRKAAVLGTPTSNNGKVVTASSGLNNNDMVATIGDMAHCPDCHGDFPIVALRYVSKTMPNGQQVALENDLVNCHCPTKPVLLVSDSTFTVEG